MPHTVMLPRPRALSKIREERLAAKQELKAVSHVLALTGVELGLIFPENPFLPLDPQCESRHSCIVAEKTLSFILNKETGSG